MKICLFMHNFTQFQDKDPEMVLPTVTRSYGRKRRQPPIDQSDSPEAPAQHDSSVDESLLLLPESSPSDKINIDLPLVDPMIGEEGKSGKTRGRRRNVGGAASNGSTIEKDSNHELSAATEDDATMKPDEDDGKPSVKLVISKKKGSIFKSRAIDVNSGKIPQTNSKHLI